MKKRYKVLLLALFFLLVSILFVMFLQDHDVIVLNPKGIIGLKEKDLMITMTLLMLIVVVPVFLLTAFVIWKYRASNPKGAYKPDWDGSHLAETIWWGLPFVIVGIMGVITWKSCVELDPFRPLEGAKKPLTVQVVALQWKWLFIYPEQGVATVNLLQIPEKTPINFIITADAPMNSFWIPQLGGQIYAMAGMTSKLHLIADQVGTFYGLSANISGVGFAGMNFLTKATTEEEFDLWVSSAKDSSNLLTLEEYNHLVIPSENSPEKVYTLKEESLYDQIIMKYTMPSMGKEMECLEN